ncbi:MAG TPA: asparagine synthase (glutamine-hydrolyzing) [Deltaproteobacteria bacterium]|jgi:asparagine synthase (glutamine-hydrolysing)|nr:asparagine synthase (glutamine-hydrolyzing) [Deltaproteobacteria bacterium]
MCGICGVVRFGRDLGDTAAPQVSRMLAALVHRGPDDSRSEHTPRAAIGATRLIIRAPGDGIQPIVGGRVVAVCNGEIDNHQELRQWLAGRGRIVQGRSDVAILPALYAELGDAFVERLIGAFALAIWDGERERLLLARDRAGERPVFFEATADGIRFASELRALAAAEPRKPQMSPAALRDYLQFGYFPAPQTAFAGIKKVRPGHLLVADAAGVQERCYWRWNLPATPKKVPSVEGFDTLFRTAVQRQTDVDVEFGVFLSGGLDSSLVAAVARSLHPTRSLPGYCVRFGDASFDEGFFAGEVASQLGMELVSEWIRPEQVPASIAELVRCVGEPLADPAWLPTAMLARRARRDVTMVLVGEGADELFGGYPTYPGARIAPRYHQLPLQVRRGIKWLVDRIPVSEKKVTLSSLLKRFVSGESLPGMARHRSWVSHADPSILEAIGVRLPRTSEADSALGSEVDLAQQWDFEVALGEGLLTKSDRAGMASALELRAPFLDLAVLEFAATLPLESRVSGLSTKLFLKRYAQRYLPRRIVHRRKRGLSVPIAGWLRRPLFDWAEKRLSAGLVELLGLDGRRALALLCEHRSARADHARLLWALLVLAEWLEWASAEGGLRAESGA